MHHHFMAQRFFYHSLLSFTKILPTQSLYLQAGHVCRFLSLLSLLFILNRLLRLPPPFYQIFTQLPDHPFYFDLPVYFGTRV